MKKNGSNQDHYLKEFGQKKIKKYKVTTFIIYYNEIIIVLVCLNCVSLLLKCIWFKYLYLALLYRDRLPYKEGHPLVTQNTHAFPYKEVLGA